MRASAIIVAAGSGTRLGMDRPKAFVALGGRTLLAWSLCTIASVEEISEAVVAVPAGMEKEARAEVAAAAVVIPVKITAGGAERCDSVRIALELTAAEAEMVVVHDAARPFATAEMFRQTLAAAGEGGAIAAIPLADTLKRVEGGAISATMARADLFCAQTPQAFRRELLIEAHRRAIDGKIQATDDAEMVERLGARVAIVAGSPINLKITTGADLEIARALAATGR